jgi:hypothetical protein
VETDRSGLHFRFPYPTRPKPPAGGRGGSKEGPTPKGTSIGGGDCLGLRATVGKLKARPYRKLKARPYRNLNKASLIAI